MPPVLRQEYGSIGVLVPAQLIDGIDWAFGVSHGGAQDYAMSEIEACWLERVCLVPRAGRTEVVMAADALVRVRNLLDIWTLNSSCEVGADPVGVGCDFCIWCQSLVLRDWIDDVLDEAGFETGGWLGSFRDGAAHDSGDQWRELMGV